MVNREEVKAFEYLGQKIARREPELSQYALNKYAVKLAVLDWIYSIKEGMSLLEAVRLLHYKLGSAAAISDLDNVSQMALRLGPLNNNIINVEKDQAKYQDLIVQIFNDPNAMLITGNLGTGKTDFSLRLAEDAIQLGVRDRIVTNIEVILGRDHPLLWRVRKTYSTSEMLREIKKRGRKILIIDEAGLHFPSRRATSRKNMFFYHIARLARKHKTKLIYITQDEEDIDKANRQLITVFARKASRRTAELTILTEQGEYVVWLEGIPRTSIRFNTLSTAPLKFDSDIEDIFKEEIPRSKGKENGENEGEEE